MGKALMGLGLVILTAGALLWLFGRHGGTGLPGDLVIERKNVRIYFPLMTCLLVSAVLSLLTWLFRR
jgi:hypothetical protein